MYPSKKSQYVTCIIDSLKKSEEKQILNKISFFYTLGLQNFS